MAYGQLRPGAAYFCLVNVAAVIHQKLDHKCGVKQWIKMYWGRKKGSHYLALGSKHGNKLVSGCIKSFV